MPNWCYNELEVQGEASELRKFVDATKTTYKDGETGETKETIGLNHLFPCPEELSNTVSGWLGDGEEQKKLEEQQKRNIEKYGHQDWYSWCNANWGTKWGACDFDWTSFFDGEMEANAKYIGAYFQSAWSPAEGLIKEISKQFPTLVFSLVYTEESDAYAGCSVFRDGVMLAEEGEEPEIPKEIEALLEDKKKSEDEKWDEYYDALSEWRTEYSDKYREKRDALVANVLVS
jgi:hypothetical protein